MISRGRPPSELPLAFEKGLDHEVPTPRDGTRKIRHAATIQIIEDHHEIEPALGNRMMSEISLNPFDGQAAMLCRATGMAQAPGVAIHGSNPRTELGGRDRMTAGPTGEIEDTRPRPNQGRMPGEPAAWPLDGRR